MKRALIMMILLSLVSLASGGPQGGAGTVIKTTGTIKHQEIEGGFWGIVGDDGQNYDPTNLAPEFQKEGLKVSFEAVPAANQMSIHMWGTIVEIKSIRKSGGSGTPADSLKPVTGVAQAKLIATWEAAKRVLAARGEALVVRDETTETIATKPHALDREALLASIKSRTKPEDSGYRHGTYELSINLTEQGEKKTLVEIKAKIMAFGTENKAMAKPDTWDPVASNGKIEKEVLKAIRAEVRRKK